MKFEKTKKIFDTCVEKCSSFSIFLSYSEEIMKMGLKFILKSFEFFKKNKNQKKTRD